MLSFFKNSFTECGRTSKFFYLFESQPFVPSLPFEVANIDMIFYYKSFDSFVVTTLGD